MSEHDDVVVQVGNVLKNLGNVCADLDSSYHGRHDLAPKFLGLEAPREVLSAFVPTQAVFTRRIVLGNDRWKEPDLAVQKDGFVYVLDVFDDNDTNTSVARKIETVIVNSAKCKIVGVAIIAKGINKRYEGKTEELKRLRETFQMLFGSPAGSWEEDDSRVYLQPLFAMDSFRRKYGDILWDRILRISVADADWATQLRDHVKAALTSKRAMASQPANSK